MSLLINLSLAEAIASFQGENCLADQPVGFSVEGLVACRLNGFEAAPGHAVLDSDCAWATVVRAWWGAGLTWGLCVSDRSGEVVWDLILPSASASAVDAVAAHLTGAQLIRGGDFPALASRTQRLPFRAAMAGHSAMGPSARLEPAIRAMRGREFSFLVLANAVSRPVIGTEIERLGKEEQFVRDEHLSRSGLEHESHSTASRYLSLIEAARARVTSALQEGGWHVRTLLAASTESDFRHAQSLVHSAFASEGGEPEPVRWQDVAHPRALTFLRSSEVAALTRPPQRDLPGFVVEARIEVSGSAGSSAPAIFATAAPARTESSPIAVGRIVADNGEPGAWLELGIADLCRHVLVAGMTGSGKTITCEHLLLELWREHRIPWLVLEPGIKTSYRRLRNSEVGADLNVWAVGKPGARRLALNPMAAPAGIGVAEHTSGLFSVISAAFELVAPMPEVLASAIEQTYRNHGWNLAGVVPNGPPPLLADLIEQIDRSTTNLGYGPEVTGNIRAGLLLRLKRFTTGPLSPELTSSAGLDVGALVARPTVIELSALPDADSQALVLGFLALQLRHHWRTAGQSDLLRHVTLIEEAHRLLRAAPETAANGSRVRAVEDLANMLAEMRAMGAGIIIVDQTPSALTPSAIANTGTKILHRLDHPADRELAGRAAGIPAQDVDLLGALRPGDAIFRSDHRPRPFRLRMPNPTVTYAKLPLPVLVEPAEPNQDRRSEHPSPLACSECASLACAAEAAGRNPVALRERLNSLLTVLREGEDAVWSWASGEVQSIGAALPAAPLCFLIALARAAKLSAGVVQRFRSAFEFRTT